MNKIVNYLSLGFIGSVTLMAVISLLGVWEILVDDVLEKSLATIGFLALVSIIIMIGYRFMHPEQDEQDIQENTWQPMFKHIRAMALTVMIGSAGILGLLGIMGIWEIVNKDFFWRSLSSIVIIAVSSCLIAVVCFEREGRGLLGRVLHGRDGGWSFWKIVIAVIIVGWILGIMM